MVSVETEEEAEELELVELEDGATEESKMETGEEENDRKMMIHRVSEEGYILVCLEKKRI